jgi:peptide/nickel transport system substrate-binding protein
MKKNHFVIFVFLLAAILAACAGEAEVVEVTRIVTETEIVEVEGEPQVVEVTRVITEIEIVTETETVVETAVPPEEPEVSEEEMARTGGWLDNIIFIREPSRDSAVARLQAGDLDVYADDIGGEAAQTAIADENINTAAVYGIYDEMFMNNATCADENVLNPFQNQNLRQAMSYMVDRNFIVDELYQGLATVKYTTIDEAGADRARFASEIREVELANAYDLERTREIVNTEMEGMGATLEDGVWAFNGEPVNVIGLIRTEDVRLQIGNYIADQLEDLGFQVERVERTSSELSPLWVSSDPLECLWNYYTGGWINTEVARSSMDNFDSFYNARGFALPAWQVFKPSEEFDDLSLRLLNSDFADLEERQEMGAQALALADEHAFRLWLDTRNTVEPASADVSVVRDLSGGISGSVMWGKTIRFVDEIGGSMTIGMPDMFTEPWNPVNGSNWIFDAMVQRGMSERAFYSNPYTGLRFPNRAERGEVVAKEGFPMISSSDWIDLTFEPEIVVPDDAWVDWDAENQVFLTAGDVYTETETAVYKSTVYFPEDLFDTITWHDGSPLSPADFVMGMIQTFDLAKEASANYDEAEVPNLQQFQSAFKGVRIVSTDPLVIEQWSDAAGLDAENLMNSWYPSDETGGGYNFGDAAWHNMAIMLRGDANGSFAFGPDKAEANEIERISLIAGPSLEILATELATASEEGWIPYAATLGDFITAEEAAARYENLAEFARRYGHYYISMGPYFLQGVFPVEGQAVLQRYEPHPDPANRYAGFGAPPLAEVDLDGPTRVAAGEEAVFDVFVDNSATGDAYAADDIKEVSYLLFDATGMLVEKGTAEAVEDGVWVITLSADTTSGLEAGSNSLEVVVVSKLVALPSTAAYQFVSE